MHNIYALKNKLMKEIEDYGSMPKIDLAGLDIVDKLAHTVKNLCKIIDWCEKEEYSYEAGQSEQFRKQKERNKDLVEALKCMMDDLSDEAKKETEEFIGKIEKM